MTKRDIVTVSAKLAVVALLIYFCGQFFIPRWESLNLSNRVETLTRTWICFALGFTLVYYLLPLLAWTIILRNLGSQPKSLAITRAYALSLLPKYIPGNVAAHSLRARLAMKAGVSFRVCVKSFFLEATFAVGTAAVICIPGAIYYFPGILNRQSALLVGTLAATLIAWVAARQMKLLSITELDRSLLWKLIPYRSVICLYLLVWLASGLAHWCLVNALGVSSISQLPRLIVAVSAAWAFGFFSVFVPSGLGVREAVLYFFVNNWMNPSDVILFVTLSRLLMFGAEVFLTVTLLLYSRLARRSQTTD